MVLKMTQGKIEEPSKNTFKILARNFEPRTSMAMAIETPTERQWPWPLKRPPNVNGHGH
jgi:hypothetical protein